MEIETPVEVLSLEYLCDRCHRGRMRPVRDPGTAGPLPAGPYQHECRECGHAAALSKLYPDIIYRMAETTVALLN